MCVFFFHVATAVHTLDRIRGRNNEALRIRAVESKNQSNWLILAGRRSMCVRSHYAVL